MATSIRLCLIAIFVGFIGVSCHAQKPKPRKVSEGLPFFMGRSYNYNASFYRFVGDEKQYVSMHFQRYFLLNNLFYTIFPEESKVDTFGIRYLPKRKKTLDGCMADQDCRAQLFTNLLANIPFPNTHLALNINKVQPSLIDTLFQPMDSFFSFYEVKPTKFFPYDSLQKTTEFYYRHDTVRKIYIPCRIHMENGDSLPLRPHIPTKYLVLIKKYDRYHDDECNPAMTIGGSGCWFLTTKMLYFHEACHILYSLVLPYYYEFGSKAYDQLFIKLMSYNDFLLEDIKYVEKRKDSKIYEARSKTLGKNLTITLAKDGYLTYKVKL